MVRTFSEEKFREFLDIDDTFSVLAERSVNYLVQSFKDRGYLYIKRLNELKLKYAPLDKLEVVQTAFIEWVRMCETFEHFSKPYGYFNNIEIELNVYNGFSVWLRHVNADDKLEKVRLGITYLDDVDKYFVYFENLIIDRIEHEIARNKIEINNYNFKINNFKLTEAELIATNDIIKNYTEKMNLIINEVKKIPGSNIFS